MAAQTRESCVTQPAENGRNTRLFAPAPAL